MIQNLRRDLAHDTNLVAAGLDKVVTEICQVADAEHWQELVCRCGEHALVLVELHVLRVGDPFVAQCLEPVVCQMIDDSKTNDTVEEVEQLDDIVGQNAKIVASDFQGVVVVEKSIHYLFS